MNSEKIDGVKELIPTILEAIEYCKAADFENVKPLIDDIIAALQAIINMTEENKLYKYILVLSTKDSSKITIDFFDELGNNLDIINKKLESIKKEVVFLPYNASMWDSLESIWLAANEDERCNSFVIPIPYYNKNEDSSLGELIYEGDKFPDYVPITHYSEYNISEKKPDIIYFHNPYDNYNRVTTVHPDYYSSKLKEYTNMLVYVPYFVVNYKLKEEFSILPGVKNSNHVIVQSEEIANEYKKYYIYQDRDKFLPIGSPKIDKVIEMSKIYDKESDIPEEWKRKIHDKKVVLYNTHLYGIMNHGDELIRKINYVFSVFEKQEKTVLLWRPHPLSKETAKAFDYKIYEELVELEERAKNLEYCIFDDTPNLHRSIAISDAYYGDRSSLVELFRRLDKPVMIQDVMIQKVKSWEELNRIPFEDAYIDDEYIWFSASSQNGLFSINKKTGETTFKGYFPGEDREGIRLFSRVIYVNNKLYFVPFNATCIVEFEIKMNEFRRIEIIDREKEGKFLSYSIYKNYIYFMPRAYGHIIRYNYINNTIDYMSSWEEKVKEYWEKEEVWFVDAALKGDILYSPLYQRNLMFKFNLKSERMQVFELGEKKDLFMSIKFDGVNFWLIPRNCEKILCWNEENNQLVYLDEYPENLKFIYDKGPFLRSMLKDEMLWILPCLADSVLIIDINTKKMKAINFKKGRLDSEIKREMFWEFGGSLSYGEDVILFPLNRESAIITDKNGKIKDSIKIKFPKEITRDCLIKKQKKNVFGDYKENGILGLFEYIKKIENEENDNKNNLEKYITSGKIISDLFLN